MTFSLGSAANGWNQVARNEQQFTHSIRRTYLNRLTSVLTAETTGAEFKVLAAISGRTLRFRKFAEAISVAQFRCGLRDCDGDLLQDEHGPYFTGCNISKDETVSRAIDGLSEKRLITRWSPARLGWPAVYMPFSEDWIAGQMALELGGLPNTYEGVHENQVLRGPMGLVRIVTGDENSITVRPVNNRLQIVGDPFTLSLREWDTYDALTPQQIREARRY